MLTNYMKKGRDPGWIELFFDLAYVVMLGRLAHILFHTHHGEIGFMEIFQFVWIFVVVFIIWMYFTVFMNIYGNNTDSQNKFSLLLMTCLIYIVVLMNDIHENIRYIALTIGFMSIIISFIYRKVQDIVPENKEYAKSKAISQLVLGLATLVVLFLKPIPAMIYILIIYSVEHRYDEYIVDKGYAAIPDTKHFIERIGIFMIILFGESFITLVNNIPSIVTKLDFFIIALILLSLYNLWINYYGFLEALEEIKFEKYRHILQTNMIVMLSLTLLSAIIYHSMIQELHLLWFKGMLLSFTILFYGGNGITYYAASNGSRRDSLLYAILPSVLISSVFIFGEDYFMCILLFALINLITGVYILYKRKKERDNSF